MDWARLLGRASLGLVGLCFYAREGWSWLLGRVELLSYICRLGSDVRAGFVFWFWLLLVWAGMFFWTGKSSCLSCFVLGFLAGLSF
jgi:hypothetical protein